MNSQTTLKTDWTWNEWRASRDARRAVAQRVAPAISRRAASSSDSRLKTAFNGRRGPAFKPS